MNKVVTLIIFFLISTTAESQFIIDNGQFFSESECEALCSKMQRIKENSSIEILIYSTIDFNGKSPIEYGLGVAKEYEVGIKGINNGIIILLSKNDKYLQILNGYGIEWIITDNETQNIVEQMITFFRHCNFFNGLNKGLTLIEEHISKVNWKIKPIEFNNISEEDIGKILKFEYTNKTGYTKYKYAIDTDPQFSHDFHINIKSDQVSFKLFYTKTMNDFISTILTKKDVIIYARLTNWKTKQLELLGIE